MDPACPQLLQTRRAHQRKRSLVEETLRTNESLALKFTLEEREEIDQHRATCERCATFDARHSCPICGLALAREVEGALCESRWHRWRIALGLYKSSRARKRATSKPAPAPSPKKAARRPAAAPAPARRANVPPQAPPRVVHAAPPPSSRPSTSATAPAHKPAKDNAVTKARAVLGLGPDASEAQISSAYREKAKQYHPDRVASLAPEFRAMAEVKMRELNEARDVLMRLASASARK